MPRTILLVSLIFWSVPVSSLAFAGTVIRAIASMVNGRRITVNLIGLVNGFVATELMAAVPINRGRP